MSLLSLKVPRDVARLLGQLEVPGEKSAVDAAHITLVYLGKGTPIAEVARAIEPIFEVTSQTRPFTVRTSLVTSFPGGDDGIPVIARIESPELHAFQGRLVAALKAAGIEYNDKWPEYKPHVTLAYIQDERPAPEDYDFPAIEWGVAEMAFWGGDDGDDGLAVTFPFSLAKAREARYKAYVRIARVDPRPFQL